MAPTILSAQEVAPVETTAPAQPEQVQPVIPPPPPPPPPIPTVKPDTSVFKRTPVINGIIESGEWDSYYQFAYGETRVTTYVNWDDENLYVAMKSNSPADLLITLDANGDGWFHGPDNYELVARHGQDSDAPTLSVSHYASQGPASKGGMPLSSTDAAAFTMKAGSGSGSYTYEVGIPRASVVGLDLQPGKKIGIKVAVGLGSQDELWIPTAPLGEVQPTELVKVKTGASSPLAVDIDLKNPTITPGDEIVAKITVKNKGNAEIAADTLVIGGEGKTAKLLGSQLIRLEGLAPGKSFSCTFRTPVPKSAALGSGAIGVEVRGGDDRLAASMLSFDILPPYEARLEVGKAPSKSGEYRRIAVMVKNNTRNDLYGVAKLNLPAGWKFKWSEGTRDFQIRANEPEQAVIFRVLAPDDYTGDAPVLAEIKAGELVLTSSAVVPVQ